jgi:hypothetical protein
MKLFTCIDHDHVYPVGVASIVVAESEAQARVLLDAALVDRRLEPHANKPYTLVETTLDTPAAYILRDGDY